VDKKHSFIYDWMIVEGSKANIALLLSKPEAAYSFLVNDEFVDLALFGKVKDDHRADEHTGAFIDGHRIITSQIVEVKQAGICTKGTHYTLGEMNPKYAEWCKKNGYDFAAALNEGRTYSSKPLESITAATMLHHICESCGKEELLSAQEGYDTGWDYPPMMGSFKKVSPRTCRSCTMDKTLWWELTHNKTPHDELSPKHLLTLERILSEPESILVKE